MSLQETCSLTSIERYVTSFFVLIYAMVIHFLLDVLKFFKTEFSIFCETSHTSDNYIFQIRKMYSTVIEYVTKFRKEINILKKWDQLYWKYCGICSTNFPLTLYSYIHWAQHKMEAASKNTVLLKCSCHYSLWMLISSICRNALQGTLDLKKIRYIKNFDCQELGCKVMVLAELGSQFRTCLK